MTVGAYNIAAVGLGSNLQDPAAQVRRALVELGELPQTRVSGVSPFYRSTALLAQGDDRPQPDYCNAVALVETALTPQHLLQCLLEIEAAHGRIRKQRWAARTLDLDLLLFGGLQLREPRLTIPHPRLHERDFVLRPLCDLAPTIHVPGMATVAELAARLPSSKLARWSE
jgi:2-amino-4-hydroxy-6-hydroxymethyldihydropteridine diphosphokinase